MVDFTESMNENQQIVSRMTVDQSKEALLKACKSGDIKTVKRLANVKHLNGVDLANFSSGPIATTPLHLACQNGHVEIAELLIRKLGAQVDQTNELGETALHLACKEGHKTVIERLLLARARTDIKDRLQGNTALHVLALANHARENVPASTITG